MTTATETALPAGFECNALPLTLNRSPPFFSCTGKSNSRGVGVGVKRGKGAFQSVGQRKGEMERERFGSVVDELLHY